MPQQRDWFETNKPKAQGDWFKENSPQTTPAAPPPTPEPERSISGFGSNVISSGLRMATDIGSAVIHPVDTAKAVGGLALGLAEKAVPGEQDAEKNVDALVQMYVDRYGGLENLKKTLYEDPIGVLADVATAAGGAGLAAKGVGLAAKTAGLAKTAQAAGKVAQVAGTISEVTDPMRYATKAAGALVPAKTAERWYESALKPSLSAKNAPRIPGQLATGLSEAIPVSEGGIRKIAKNLKDIRDSVNQKIAAARGVTIDPQEVAKRLDATQLQFGNQALPKQDLAAIDAARAQWLDRYAIKDPVTGAVTGYNQIPVEEAQKLKTGTYAVNSKKYGELSAASMEAEKALARGIKEELENVIPELKGLNARSGVLIELDKQLVKAVRRRGNWEIFGPGIYGSLGGIGVGMASGSAEAGAVTGAILTLLRDPNVKSRLAIAIDRARKVNPGKWGKPGYSTALSRVQEYEDALAAYTGGKSTSQAAQQQQ